MFINEAIKVIFVSTFFLFSILLTIKKPLKWRRFEHQTTSNHLYVKCQYDLKWFLLFYSFLMNSSSIFKHFVLIFSNHSILCKYSYPLSSYQYLLFTFINDIKPNEVFVFSNSNIWLLKIIQLTLLYIVNDKYNFGKYFQAHICFVLFSFNKIIVEFNIICNCWISILLLFSDKYYELCDLIVNKNWQFQKIIPLLIFMVIDKVYWKSKFHSQKLRDSIGSFYFIIWVLLNLS